MKLTGIPISISIVITIWIVVLTFIFVSKYRNRRDVHLLDTERRRNERRSADGTDCEPVLEVNEDPERRDESDRRETQDWHSEYRAIRTRIEDETDRKDI